MVSNVGDAWAEKFPHKWPYLNPPPVFIPPEVSRDEVDALRNEIQELKKLLEAAKKFDQATGQPDCEMEAKVKLIKEIAKLVGVELGDVFQASP